MMAAFAKANLPIAKLTAIATDGAPAMIGSVNGLVGLCQADQTFPGFWNFHCIIHREQLVSKSLNLDNVMKPVMEIVNYIRTHALNHRQFKNLIAALDQGLPGDLPLHCTVRWLSKGQVLSRFFELLDAVKLFMEEKDKDYPVLSDLEWIMDLAFLVDMLCHLDRLNLTLQATSAALNKQRARYATLVENLHESFVARFRDLQLKRPQITFLVDPFNAETDCLKALLVTDEAAAELEMIDLCEEDQLKPALREGTINQSETKSHIFYCY
ncbi:general transcription factor II-I repeat domain-containing protein 2A-like [Stigmatopora nigra]